ncbi:MAG: magnesium transporter [Ignavibacteriaceae bacterium]|nr:magnesium transporter [Ignavibacteriaceae bacterium]
MLGNLLFPEIEDLIVNRNLATLREVLSDYSPADLADLITDIPSEKDQAVVFRLLSKDIATDTFEYLDVDVQISLMKSLAKEEVAGILNEMAPDDRTALLEELPAPVTKQMLMMLSPDERSIANKLLGYKENTIGRLMTPDYISIREDLTVEDVLANIRKYGKDSETLNVIYIVDDKGKLIDDIRIREILLSPLDKKLSELMDGNFIHLIATDDQETAVQVFKDYDRTVLPVTDNTGILMGIVTIDDVLDVAEEEATEDIQKLGGSEALEEPYSTISLFGMVQKRAGWLSILFIGEMFTATAMGFFEHEIAKAVVLALFVPLIIASGGNSGSQASTLVIRALSLGEIRVADWWFVVRREFFSGLILGSILAVLGFVRVGFGQMTHAAYGEYWYLIGLAVSFALVGVVTLGTLVGSALPLALKKLGFDPATSSAPFVATLVDVTGLLIYFGVALMLLSGKLL